ncbi:3'-5' exonuclease [Thermosynechococcaceae cyanobacterium BACA0444]|uniref:3'-5' exonuclease n=1 Tax=Pseudocalidococcus azoricus BACA0444 TaxID=2918990 RepID=A0AAE4FSM5_9CYAN|nr:3'-5' exonuclease [Pseudocalidococcus azoricus]MDS3861440.1 3'-5' exonuclease [Pseudocalidococcus azoricus BACA0444]
MLHSQDILALYRHLGTSDLTVVDVETTGSKPDHNWVIEISVLQGCPRAGITKHRTQLIKPPIPIPQDIQRFTGITPEMVIDAPDPTQVWPEFFPLLDTGIFTAHNLEFDYGFIQSEYKKLNIPFSRPLDAQFCTVKLSRILLAHLKSRRLPDLVRHFDFPVDTSHRAEADTLACWYLTLELVNRLEQTPDGPILEKLGQEWLTLEDATQLLGTDVTTALRELMHPRIVNKCTRRGEILFQRHSVERIC